MFVLVYLISNVLLSAGWLRVLPCSSILQPLPPSPPSTFKRYHLRPTAGVRARLYFKTFIFHFISFSLNHHLRVARVAAANPTGHEVGVVARD